MPRRSVIVTIGVAGLVVAGLGVASATLWRPSDVLRASVTAGTPYVVTDAGVVELGGSPTTITATVPGDAAVTVAVGRAGDVAAWVGQDPVTEISGLSGWHTLAVRPSAGPTASGSASPQASATASVTADQGAAAGSTAASTGATATAAAVTDPAGSDLWLAESTGTGSATLTWSSTDPGSWSVLVASPSGVAPTLQLAWPRAVSTPWLLPGVLVGGLLVLTAGLLAGRVWWQRRGTWTSVETGALPVLSAPVAATAGLTRRQLRELQQHTAPTPLVGDPVAAGSASVDPAAVDLAPGTRSSGQVVSDKGSAGGAALAGGPAPAPEPARSWLPGWVRRSGTAAPPAQAVAGSWRDRVRGRAEQDAAAPTATSDAPPVAGATAGTRASAPTTPAGSAPPAPAGPARPSPAAFAPTPTGPATTGPTPPTPTVDSPSTAVPAPARAGWVPGRGAAGPRPSAPPHADGDTRPSWLRPAAVVRPAPVGRGPDDGRAGPPGRPAPGTSSPVPTPTSPDRTGVAGSPVTPDRTDDPVDEPAVESRADAWRRTWGIAAKGTDEEQDG